MCLYIHYRLHKWRCLILLLSIFIFLIFMFTLNPVPIPCSQNWNTAHNSDNMTYYVQTETVEVELLNEEMVRVYSCVSAVVANGACQRGR